MRAHLVGMTLDEQKNRIEIDDIKEIIRLSSNATNNSNQIAKRANETDSIYTADLDELRGRYDELREQARRILREILDLMDQAAGSCTKQGRLSKRRPKSRQQTVDS